MSALSWGIAWWKEATTRTEECHELLAEVRDGERRERELHGVIYAYRTRLTLSELENRKLRYQLAQADERRTTGGSHRGYTPDWTPNPGANVSVKLKDAVEFDWSPAKFDGAGPPPYTPAIETGKVES
jgi:hypothetical protein